MADTALDITWERCPECGEPYVMRCRCMRGDMRCPNGHEWHHCEVHGTLVLHASDHGKEGCSCGKGD